MTDSQRLFSVAKGEAEAAWRGRASALRQLIFLAWAVEYLTKALVVSGSATLLCYICFRWDLFAYDQMIQGALLSFLLTLTYTLFRVRKHSVSDADCLAVLDATLGCNNRLTSAAAGISPWPNFVRSDQQPIAFLFRPLARRGIAILILVLGALLVPVRSVNHSLLGKREKPTSVVEVEAWIEKLRKEQIVEEQALSNLQEKLSTITEQPEERWYDHHSLEASATLKEQTEQAVQALANEIDKATSTLDQLAEALAAERSPAELQKLLDSLEGATSALGSNALPLTKELADKLAELDAQQLNKKDLESLREALRQKRDALQSMQGGQSQDPGADGAQGSSSTKSGSCPGGGEGPFCSDNGVSSKGNGNGQNDGSQPGNGGISRGPGTAPLLLEERPPQMTSNRTEVLAPANDPSKDPADLLGIKSKAPNVPETTSAGAGGEAKSEDGEMAVGQRDLTPEEQEVLKRYFK